MTKYTGPNRRKQNHYVMRDRRRMATDTRQPDGYLNPSTPFNYNDPPAEPAHNSHSTFEPGGGSFGGGGASGSWDSGSSSDSSSSSDSGSSDSGSSSGGA